MHSSIGRLGIGLLAVAATAFVACGGGDGDGATTAQPAATQAPATPTATQAATAAGSVGITMTEFAIVPGEPSVGAGEVTFEVTNGGAAPHELVVIRTDIEAAALPLAAGAADESGLDVVGRTGMILGGGSESVTFTLTAGSYLLICNIPAHYTLGMTVAFTVQ
ncbi:MAG: plastocyanin/azurin family copper-binding protein [Dehalococcoidia bacterium]